MEISAVPSASNPAVGYQIEISTNIIGGSNVIGYDFKLTFNPTILEFNCTHRAIDIYHQFSHCNCSTADSTRCPRYP